MINRFFFSEQPISIKAGNNEYKHKDNKINKKQQKSCIDYREKINTTTTGHEIKKSASTTTKEMPNEGKGKNTITEIVKPEIFNLLRKTLSRYIKLIFFCET